MLALGMAVSPLLVGSVLADANWTGATSTDWNTLTNWDADPSGTNVNINTNTGNIATVTADQAFVPIDIRIGVGAGTSGRVDHRAGLVTTGNAGNWMFVGNNGGTGVYNLANTAVTGTGITGYGQGTGSLTVAGNLYIGGRYFDEPAGTGTVNINTTGTLTANLFDVFDNNNSVGTGVVNLENGTVTSNGEFWVGAWGTGSGTFNQTGGTANSNAWFVVGRGNHDGGTGTYNISGGTVNGALNNGFIVLGSFGGATGTMNVTGGTVNTPRQFYVGEGGNGTLNVSGTGTVSAGNGMIIAANGGSSGTVNLNAGGTIAATSISKGAGTGAFNLNGGTIRALGDSTNFIVGAKLNVQAGGAKIDTNGKNITVNQALDHDATLTTADGGLTKSGAGTLTLGGGTSTYTGATTISGGTLRLASGGPPQAVGRYTFDELTTGSLAGGVVVANTGTGGAALNGAVNHADNIFDTNNGGASVVTGHTGKGLALDGLGSSVDVASRIVDQSGGTSWTFSAWINTTEPGSSILSKDDGNASWNQGDSVFYLGSNPISGTAGSLPTAVRNSGGFIQGDPTPTSLTDGAWHMVTFVSNAGTKTIYVDGVATTMTIPDFNLGDSTTLSRFGKNIDTLADRDGNVDFFGTMDELQFYDTALNGTQIQQLFTTNTVTSGVGSQQYLPTTTALNISASGASLDLNNNSQTIGSLAGVAGSSVVLGTATLTTGANNTAASFAGVISGTGGVTKVGTGNQTLTGANTYSGVTTVKAGTLTLATAAQANVLGSATVTSPAGADVQGGKLVLQYSGTSLATQVQTILDAGYDQPVKFSAGKIRSTTIATNRVLGWRDTGSSIEVAYTLAGDADLNFKVEFADLLTLAKNYNGTGKVWSQGDFDYSGTVAFADLLSLAKNYNQTVSASQASLLGEAFSADFALAQSMVPEPTTLGVIAGLGGAALIRRRKPTK